MNVLNISNAFELNTRNAFETFKTCLNISNAFETFECVLNIHNAFETLTMCFEYLQRV